MFAASKSGRAASAVATDPYFPYVPLLLESTSTNGQQNNTFLDSSTNNYTITRNGTPTQGSVTPYWPDGYWSNYFNGSTDYLTVASNAALNLTADFTVETWAFATATTNAVDQVFNYGFFIFMLYHNGTSWTVEIGNGSSNYFTLTGTASLNAWHHFAITRNANTYTFWIDGASAATTTNANAPATSGATLSIARSQGSSTQWFTGYLSNFRIVKGTAVYTSAFTPPTTPLTAITNTSLLTCQSNRFRDNSTNNFTITVNGTPRVQAFQPFSPTASYTAAAYGGSGYFNGSTDYLTGTSPDLSGTWTIEFWWYPTSVSAQQTIISFNAGSYSGVNILCTTSGQLTVDNGVTAQSSFTTVAFKANQWNHVAIVRNVTTTTGYINGAVAGSNSFTPLTTNSFSIGRFNVSTYNYVTGYISNLRVVNTVAVYTGAFTPPTLAPLTTAGSTSAASYSSTTNVNTSFAGSNTSLLTNFTNAGIYDAAVQNNAITVGDAQASTTQYKWSPTSIKFDGTGDYLTMPTTNIPALAGAFTIEAWVYFSAISGTAQTLCGKWSASLLGWLIQITSSNVSFSYGNGTTFTAALNYATTLTSGTWYYLAITRNSSNSVQAYINGSAIGSAQTASGSLNSTAAFAIGINLDGTQQPFNGYIQDLRITNGVARTITTPTAAFPTR